LDRLVVAPTDGVALEELRRETEDLVGDTNSGDDVSMPLSLALPRFVCLDLLLVLWLPQPSLLLPDCTLFFLAVRVCPPAFFSLAEIILLELFFCSAYFTTSEWTESSAAGSTPWSSLIACSQGARSLKRTNPQPRDAPNALQDRVTFKIEHDSISPNFEKSAFNCKAPNRSRKREHVR
jgi:hypothetical protein